MPKLIIGEAADADIDAVVALWLACGLTRPWNDPRADIEVIDYLATPPDPATLRQLLDEMGIPARDLLRSKEPACR